MKVSGSSEIGNGLDLIYSVLFGCITQEIRRRQLTGMTHNEICMDRTFAERVKELVLTRLGVEIPEKAGDRIIELDSDRDS